MAVVGGTRAVAIIKVPHPSSQLVFQRTCVRPKQSADSLELWYTELMYSIDSYLPAETIRHFIKSVRKAIENHPNPTSDANLKEMKRLAEELEADALRRKREREAQARREIRGHRRKLEVNQRHENARVASRKPGDFSSGGLIGFIDSTKR